MKTLTLWSVYSHHCNIYILFIHSTLGGIQNNRVNHKNTHTHKWENRKEKETVTHRKKQHKNNTSATEEKRKRNKDIIAYNAVPIGCSNNYNIRVNIEKKMLNAYRTLNY